jgi:hypothetical protein
MRLLITDLDPKFLSFWPHASAQQFMMSPSLIMFSTFLILLLCTCSKSSENQKRLKSRQIDSGRNCWSLKSASSKEHVGYAQIAVSYALEPGMAGLISAVSLKSELSESLQVHAVRTLLSSVWFNPVLTEGRQWVPPWEFWRLNEVMIRREFWNNPRHSVLENKQCCCLHHGVFMNSLSC